MSGTSEHSLPFDFSAILDDMHTRYGWKAEDLSAAMMQLLPAAAAGYRHFGMPGLGAGQGSAGQSFFDAMSTANPFAVQPDPVHMFYGPEPVRTMIADHIAKVTGLQREAIGSMMPVASALAMGSMMRPYLNEPGQDLLDAFLRGFVRGRPKPRPTPVDYFQGYQEAVGAFWSSFLKPVYSREDAQLDGDADGPAASEPEVQSGIAETSAEEQDGEMSNQAADVAVQDSVPSEFDQFFSDWMSTGRDLQSAQFRAFDDLFDKAAREADAPDNT